MAYAYDSLIDKEVHHIKVKDLVHVLNFSSKNDDYLKQSLESLVTSLVTWNILDKDTQSWGVTTLLSHAAIEDGICHYSYSPVLREYLYNPRMYARISLSMQNKFSSKYTLAMYELCVDYLNFETGRGETPFISIDSLRELMGLHEGEYGEFKKLNQKVLKPSVMELNEVSDINVSLVFDRISRRIISAKFCVTRKSKVHMDKQVIQKPLQSLRNDSDKNPLVLRLQNDFCLSERQAAGVYKRFPDTYISEILDVVESDFKSGKVNNLAPYTLRALEDDFRTRKSSFEIEQEKKKELARLELERRRQAEDDYKNLKEKFSSFKKRKTTEYLASMAEGDRLKIFEDFLSEHVEKNSFMRSFLTKEGRDSSMIQSLFHEFVCDEFLPNECSAFEEFSSMQGFSIVQDGEAVRVS